MVYCILRNISQNTFYYFYSHSILKRDQITIYKKCRKEILNINSLVTPCLTNGYFSGQYKIILEFLNDYDKAKIT